MKKILFFSLLLFSITVHAQNVVSLTFQPGDLGLGLRYDREIKQSGFYVSATKGNYALGESYVKDHLKGSAGVLFKNYSLGIAYHSYGERVGEFTKNAFKPVSLEAGVRVSVDWFVACIRVDSKGEGTIDFGIRF